MKVPRREFIVVVGDQERLVTGDEREAVAAFRANAETVLLLVAEDGSMLEWDGCGWTIVFKPGAAPRKNVYGTWADVSRIINGSVGLRGGINVLIDDSGAPAVAPPDSGTLDCTDKAVTFLGKKIADSIASPGALSRLTICDGTPIEGPATFCNLSLDHAANGAADAVFAMTVRRRR